MLMWRYFCLYANFKFWNRIFFFFFLSLEQKIEVIYAFFFHKDTPELTPKLCLKHGKGQQIHPLSDLRIIIIFVSIFLITSNNKSLWFLNHLLYDSSKKTSERKILLKNKNIEVWCIRTYSTKLVVNFNYFYNVLFV